MAWSGTAEGWEYGLARVSDTHRVVVVGCGHVGYPLSLMIASAGNEVLAVDIDGAVVEAVNAGSALFDGDDFIATARAVHRSGLLTAAPYPRPADVFVIAVPTPVDQSGRQADLSAVEAAARTIGPYLESGALVIVESTVPPGTCTGVVADALEESGPAVGDGVHIAHCPERVHPGETLAAMVRADRIIGGVDEGSTRAASRFYATFSKGDLVETDSVTAEVAKLMENTYRDVNIALANQIGAIAAEYGIDAVDVIRIANGHPRVDYLTPGIGVGGHCIPVDPWFLLPDPASDVSLIGAARRVNDAQPNKVANLIEHEVYGIAEPRIVLVGAAYKADVSDTRNAPALRVREILAARGHDVVTYDPLTSRYDGDLVALSGRADLLVVLVPHRRVVDEIRESVDELSSRMRRMRMIDVSGGVVREFR